MSYTKAIQSVSKLEVPHDIKSKIRHMHQIIPCVIKHPLCADLKPQTAYLLILLQTWKPKSTGNKFINENVPQNQ
jgi:hypothetical protein